MNIHIYRQTEFVKTCIKLPLLITVMFLAAGKIASAGLVTLSIAATLGNVQNLLAQLGPTLSAVLFVTAGIFYALGQLMPPTKRASMHSTAVDIIIGAVIVAALSLAAGSFAYASEHLLLNLSSNSLTSNAV